MKKISKPLFIQFIAVALGAFFMLLAVLLYARAQEWLRDGKEAASIAFDDLNGAVNYFKKQDFEKADFLFRSAGQIFAEAEKKWLLKPIETHWQGAYAQSAYQLLETGKALTRIGQQMTELIQSVQKIPQQFIRQNTAGSKPEITILLKEAAKKLKSIQKSVEMMEISFKKIAPQALPEEWQEKRNQGEQAIEFLKIMLASAGKIDTSILKLLGSPLPHRYLVLFQNRYEVRATGGFIGSYAIVDVNDGTIKKIDFKDVYSSDGQLREVLPPPPGLSSIARRYTMRDANYSPDFPTSAKKIMWFLEHSRGPSVDTVITIDQTVIEELLRITGPIPLGKWGLSISADSFNALFSYFIESKVISAGNPKEILGNLIPVLKIRLLANKNYSAFLRSLKNLIESGHIQAYSNDSGAEELWKLARADGQLLSVPEKTDFLAVIDTSISGNKSDRFIKTTLQHTTIIETKAPPVDHLVIDRQHTWQESDVDPIDTLWKKFGAGKLDRETLIDILGRGANKDFMRIYVPKGSELSDVQGVDLKTVRVYEELGYTVFSFQWPAIPAGKKAQVSLDYELPFALDPTVGENSTFVFQKQAGVEGQTLEKIVTAGEGVVIKKAYPKPSVQEENEVIQQVSVKGNWFSVTALSRE
ncbi:DUF4012 domain-containing protein [Candidatus Peregrinibacteria bacterium]|nr:DUF4012 domain-containing protein [Candidatus Peregrinibacteria bacterium]